MKNYRSFWVLSQLILSLGLTVVPFSAAASSASCPIDMANLEQNVLEKISSQGSLSREAILAALPKIKEYQQIRENKLRVSNGKKPLEIIPFVVDEKAWPLPYLVYPQAENRSVGEVVIFNGPYTERFICLGNTISKMDWSGKGTEIYQTLNRTYVVDKSGQISDLKLSDFLLSQVSTEYIYVTRAMSWQEHDLWRAKDLKKLREGVAKIGRSGWSYFTLGKSVWVLGSEVALFKIPISVAREWSKKDQLFMASLDILGDPNKKYPPLEVSIHEEVWEKLADYYVDLSD